MINKILKNTVSLVFPDRLLIKGRQNSEMQLALTFDDGPHPQNTSRILEIFKEHESKATFFVQGAHAEKYPRLIESILAQGHQLGNHGYSHLNATHVGSQEYIDDILKAQETLEAIAGKVDSMLFRPPYGAVTLPTFLKLTQRGFCYVLWSVDSRDSFVGDSETLISSIRKRPFNSGDIVLMHEDYELTVEALGYILADLKSSGFSLVTVATID